MIRTRRNILAVQLIDRLKQVAKHLTRGCTRKAKRVPCGRYARLGRAAAAFAPGAPAEVGRLDDAAVAPEKLGGY